MSVLKNLALFKLGWLACVLGAANNLSYVGPIAVVLIVAEHLRTSDTPNQELWIVAMAAMLGMGWESLMVSSGLVQYGDSGISAGLAPLWIIAMWMLFATTLNVGMKWLRNHWALAMTGGAIGGPMAFFAGATMGAVEFAHTPLALLVIGLGWALMLPLLSFIAALFHHEPSPMTQAARVAA